MSDSNKMSRRDWFRLRPQRTEPEAATTRKDSSLGEKSRELRPVEQPVNHDGMDLSELPPMREACLSLEQVCELFADIQSHASDILLMQRTGRTQRASASRATTAEQLPIAQKSLLSGSTPRIQIRYHWQDSDWIDTLELRSDGVRLIRIAHNTDKPARRASR